MSLPGVSPKRGIVTKTSKQTYKYVHGSSPSSSYSFEYDQVDQNQVFPESPRKIPWGVVPTTLTPFRQPGAYAMTVSHFKFFPYRKEVTYAGENRTDIYESPSSYWVGSASAYNEVGDYYGGSDRFPRQVTNDLRRAEVEALLKLADGKANMGENIATARQTASLLGDSVSAMAKLLLAARRKQFSGIKDASKSVSDLYLQWIYGYKPLAQDIYNTVESLPKVFKPAMLLNGQRTIQSEDDQSNSNPDGSGHFRHCQYRTKVRLDACLSKSRMAQIARSANQWGLLNPASLTWNLIPWSFAVDWVLPVGNVLDAMTATVGLDFVGGSATTVAQGYRENWVAPSPYPSDVEPFGPPKIRTERFGMVRDIYFDFPKPQGYIKSPFSNSHTLTAMALLRQLVRKI